jgi:hypothetical protein
MHTLKSFLHFDRVWKPRYSYSTMKLFLALLLFACLYFAHARRRVSAFCFRIKVRIHLNLFCSTVTLLQTVATPLEGQSAGAICATEIFPATKMMTASFTVGLFGFFFYCISFKPNIHFIQVLPTFPNSVVILYPKWNGLLDMALASRRPLEVQYLSWYYDNDISMLFCALSATQLFLSRRRYQY